MLRLQGVWLYLKIILGPGGRSLCQTRQLGPERKVALSELPEIRLVLEVALILNGVSSLA